MRPHEAPGSRTPPRRRAPTGGYYRARMTSNGLGGSLVVASNRGPLSFRFGQDGALVPSVPAGGLAATLRDLLVGSGATWISVAMGDADRAAARAAMLDDTHGLTVRLVEPDPETYRMAYDVISNATLWFCHHQLWDLPRRPRFDHRWQEAWTAYRALNRGVADAIADAAAERATVLVQDYHLSLVGGMLASARPDLATVHFTHTPFGGPDALRVLPSAAARELVEGMRGFGACGFHARRWEQAYRACAEDPQWSGEPSPHTTLRTFTAPLGPDPGAITEEAATPEVGSARRALTARAGGRRLIVRVDRVELSKNIVRGIWAMDELLEHHAQWRGAVVLLALAYPSREGLAEYLSYRAEIEHAAEVVNEAWGTDEWVPVQVDIADNRQRSVAALCEYDVLLVNPVRDGLNLVAKEGPLVNRRDGVVVLSREAGAWDELQAAAIGVNPFDISDTAQALHRALEMPAGERRERADVLRGVVTGRTAAQWLDDQLDAARQYREGLTG